MKRVTYKALQALVEAIPFCRDHAYGVGAVGFAIATHNADAIGFVEVHVERTETQFAIHVRSMTKTEPIHSILVPRVASEGMLKMTVRRLVRAIEDAARIDFDTAAAMFN